MYIEKVQHISIDGMGIMDLSQARRLTEFDHIKDCFSVTIAGREHKYHGLEMYRKIERAICEYRDIPMIIKRPKLKEIKLDFSGIDKITDNALDKLDALKKEMNLEKDHGVAKFDLCPPVIRADLVQKQMLESFQRSASHAELARRQNVGCGMGSQLGALGFSSGSAPYTYGGEL